MNKSYIEINIDNINTNISNIKNKLPNNTMLAAVLKADAYSHGSSIISKYIRNVDYIMVASLNEALEIRRIRKNIPILIMGYTESDKYDDLLDYNITPTIFSYDEALILSTISINKGKVINIHIKIDTGMNRLGMRYFDDPISRQKTIKEIVNINSLKGVNIKGIFTHHAKADQKNKNYAVIQEKRFNHLLKSLNNYKINIDFKHVQNSAAIMEKVTTNYNMVRMGVIIYGLWPYPNIDKEIIDLKPALSIRGIISKIEDDIVYISIGYLDGIDKRLKRIITDNGIKKILKVNENSISFRSDGDNYNIGDLTTILGKQNSHEIFIDDMAKEASTIHCEILLMLNRNLERRYYKNGVMYETL